MNKTKLGISNCLVASMFYFMLFLTVFFSSTYFALPALVLGAYVLAKEEDLWLKACVVKGTFILFFVGLIVVCFGFVDDILDFINFFIGIAHNNDYNAESYFLRDGFGICNWIKNIIYVITKIFYIVLSFVALSGKTIKLPFIDKMIGKHFQ